VSPHDRAREAVEAAWGTLYRRGHLAKWAAAFARAEVARALRPLLEAVENYAEPCDLGPECNICGSKPCEDGSRNVACPWPIARALAAEWEAKP